MNKYIKLYNENGLCVGIEGHGGGGGSTPQVEPKRVTHAALVALRDEGKLIAGQLYRITDYVATVNEFLANYCSRSAGHPFDIVVMALTNNTLSEDACAALHDGDTYFANSRLEAWQLKYRLDNVLFSCSAGIYAFDSGDGYLLKSTSKVSIDGEEYFLWDASEFYLDYGFQWAVSTDAEVGSTLKEYDPETGEIGDYEISLDEVYVEEENGKGTVTWMRDEFQNECPYDFKNMQFKRMHVEDDYGFSSISGYMADHIYPSTLSVDEENYIWAYTFSSDASGGEQEDYSLGSHDVYCNVIDAGTEDGAVVLGRNVCYGDGVYNNYWGKDCVANTLGHWSSNNKFGNDTKGCILSGYHNKNSFGNGMSRCTFGNGCSGNRIGNDFWNNTVGYWFVHNTIGNNCEDNAFENIVSSCTYFDGVVHTKMPPNIKYAQVLNGVQGTDESRQSLNFSPEKTYTQVAAMTSAGVLKIYVPGDLA